MKAVDCATSERTIPEDLGGQRAVVMGLGRFGGGIGVTRWLCGCGAEVLVTDRASEADLAGSLEALKDLNVSYRLGGHAESDLDGCDLLVVNPAVDKRKAPFFKSAVRRGVPWTSEMNLFLERCRGRIVGVTGTVGKSTTTAMIGAILGAAERSNSRRQGSSWIGGNIGKSLLDDLPRIRDDDVVVLELSSFQLEDAAAIRRSPHIAVVTNIRENHLDRHGTMEAYAAAKSGIYRFQREGDWLILPVESGVEWLSASWQGRPNVWRFDLDQAARRIILDRPDPDGRTREELFVELSIPGLHNLHNAAAALAVSRLLGVPDEVAKESLSGFTGLAHRLEFVCEHDGVKYYNDSKATTPEAAMTSIRAFECGVIMLLGGSDKGTSFDELGRQLAESAKAVICMGATGPRISKAVLRAGENAADTGSMTGGAGVPPVSTPSEQRCCNGVVSGPRPIVRSASNIQEAVSAARDLAHPGDVVLLSPACASFDWFRNYEHRGESFKELVHTLASDP